MKIRQQLNIYRLWHHHTTCYHYHIINLLHINQNWNQHENKFFCIWVNWNWNQNWNYLRKGNKI